MTLRRAALASAFLLVLSTVGTVGSVPVTTAAAAAVCDDAPLPNAPTVKVLVMGDSLTQEFAGDYTWRYRFWEFERNQGVNIDFVGPYKVLMGTFNTPILNNTEYADPCFDQDHFAIGGKDLASTLQLAAWDSAQPQRSEVAWATATYRPDVVLGFMGYNDLKTSDPNALYGHHGYTANQVVDSAKAFIDQVQGAVPGTPVGMVTVASTKAPQLVVDGSAYNTALANAIQTWKQTLPVGLVDINADWQGAPNDTWDGYHPNANGEMHLAWDVSDGLHALVPAIAALNRPIPLEPLGPQTVGAVSVISSTASSVGLTWTFPIGANREVLYRRDVSSSNTTWQKILDLPQATEYTDNSLAPHRYEYRVQAAKGTALAADVATNPLYSPVLTVDLRPIGPVSDVAIQPQFHALKMTWAAAATADRYRVRWRRTGSSTWHVVGSPSTSAVIGDLLGGASYDVRIVPVRADVTGPASGISTAEARGAVNAPVPRPVVAAVSGHRLRVSWARAAHATRYQLRIRAGHGSWTTLGWTSATHFTSPRLVRGRRYAVAVIAWDSYVPGRASAAARFRNR